MAVGLSRITTRTSFRLLAAAVVCVGAIWATYPAVLYAYSWFIYPLYYYPFRYRSVVQEFPMKWQSLPPESVDGYYLAKPVWLRFAENPNYGVIVDGAQIGSPDATVPVLISVHGDRYAGATGFTIERIGAVPYGAVKPISAFIRCGAAACGANPLDRIICRGPCRSERLPTSLPLL